MNSYIIEIKQDSRNHNANDKNGLSPQSVLVHVKRLVQKLKRCNESFLGGYLYIAYIQT